MKSPDVTLLLGPQTRLGRALNDIVRETRGELAKYGLTAYPSRVGDKALRDMQAGASCEDIRATLSIGEGPVLLTATKGLGAPANSFRSRELLPDAESYLAKWGALLDGLSAQVILTIDPLPTFFAELNHASANTAVAATPWDALYEVSWADLATEISAALPDAQLTVLTAKGAFVSAETVVPFVFGDGAAAVPVERLRAAILEIPEDADWPRNKAKLNEFFEQHVGPPDRTFLKDTLGMDSVTVDLLESRFREDLVSITEACGVQLI